MKELDIARLERPFNGAKETSDDIIFRLMGEARRKNESGRHPIILDLFAYYQNERTEEIARNNPNAQVFSIGLEMEYVVYKFNEDLFYPPNYVRINKGALSFLQMFDENSVQEVHVICTLPDNEYTKLTFKEIFSVLSPGGKLITVDFADDSYTNGVTTRLQTTGFTTHIEEIDEIDLLSDWVSKHHLFNDPLVKIVAEKPL